MSGSTNANRSGTFFYTPDIAAYIESELLAKDGTPAIIDVSEDIIDFNIQRNVNSTSTAELTLANPKWKYTPLRKPSDGWGGDTSPIETMDKIVIYLKRTDYIQVFSGYVTLAPILTLIPQPVRIRAHCTLYTVQNTYWDPNVPELQKWIPGMLMSEGAANSQGGAWNAASFADGGSAQGIVNLLTEIAGWDKSRVHVGGIPPQWVKEVVSGDGGASVQSIYAETEYKSGALKSRLIKALDGGGIMSGYNVTSNGDSVWNGPFKIYGANGTVTKTVTSSNAGYSTLQSQTAIPNGSQLYAVLPQGGFNFAISSEGILGVRTDYVSRLDAIATYLDPKPDTDDAVRTKSNSISPVNVFEADTVWWCILPWPTLGADAQSWLANDGVSGKKGRKILLTSVANGNQVVVHASFRAEKGLDDKIAISPTAWKALAGEAVDTTAANGQAINFYTDTVVAVNAVWAQNGADAGVQDSSGLVDKLNTFGVVLGNTLAQKGPEHPTLAMTFEDWVHLALAKADLPTDQDSALAMAEWAVKVNNVTAGAWDDYCNPLNMTYLADKCANGRYSYPNLYVAAIAFALFVNPPPTMGPSGNGTPGAPIVRAALSDNLNHIKKPGYKSSISNYSDRFYFSMYMGLVLGTYDPAAVNYDYINELREGTKKVFKGVFWHDFSRISNSPGTNAAGDVYILRREVLSSAITNDNWPNKNGYVDAKNPRGLFNKGSEVATAEALKNKGSLAVVATTTDRQSIITRAKESRRTWARWERAGAAGFESIREARLPIRGLNPTQGSQSETGTNANRDAAIAKFRRLVNSDDIPDDVSPNVSPGKTFQAGTASAFNLDMTQPNLNPLAISLFGSARGFITDEPLLGAIANIATSSLRDFQTAPNGDFVAWFPDYFGLYDYAPPVFNIYDIEIVDFTIYHDDTPLTTHVAVAGDPFTMGQSVDLAQWMESSGIISVQIPQVMKQLFGGEYDVIKKLLDDGSSVSGKFLKRYGLRPRVESVPMIRSHVTEFMYAWRTFLMGWAAQYSTTVHFTFMPELYPGMRLRLADHDIEVYVQAVSHQGSRSSGFSTSAQITCPVIAKNGKKEMLHYGYPYRG